MAEQTRNPTSDEAVAGTWTGSAGSRWQVVDDYPDTGGADELTHGTATPGNLTFGFTAFSIPAGSTSISVAVDYYDYKNGSQSCNMAGRLKVGASYFNSSTHNPGNGSGNRTQRTDTWATNPAGGNWTVDQINGTAGSNNLVAFGWNSSDANPSITLSSIRLRVTYTEPVAIDCTIASSQASQTGATTATVEAAASIGSSSTSQTSALSVGVEVDAGVAGAQASQTSAIEGTVSDPSNEQDATIASSQATQTSVAVLGAIVEATIASGAAAQTGQTDIGVEIDAAVASAATSQTSSIDGSVVVQAEKSGQQSSQTSTIQIGEGPEEYYVGPHHPARHCRTQRHKRRF